MIVDRVVEVSGERGVRRPGPPPCSEGSEDPFGIGQDALAPRAVPATRCEADRGDQPERPGCGRWRGGEQIRVGFGLDQSNRLRGVVGGTETPPVRGTQRGEHRPDDRVEQHADLEADVLGRSGRGSLALVEERRDGERAGWRTLVKVCAGLG